MKTVIARIDNPTMATPSDKAITLWQRGASWYLGIRHGDNSNTILHCGSEQYIRGVWKRKYVKRAC